MATMNTEVLHLRQVPGSSLDSCATRPITGEILEAFREMFAHADAGSEHQALDQQLSQQAKALAAARGASAITKAGEPVVTTCRAATSAVVRRQVARQRDIATLVAMVRDTVESLVAGHKVSAAALGESTNRLEHMQHVSDFGSLKKMLAAEVVTLRKIASDREAEHEKTVSVLQQRLTNAEAQLCEARSEARIDPLTEVANRRGFDIVLADRVKSSDPVSPLVLALFDVDGFKRINDCYGHPAGDAILQHVARSVRAAVRQDDLVARIGGDEFALIASGLTLAQAEARLRTILLRISGDRIGAEQITVSLSCGVSEHSAGDTVQTLFSRSDAALLNAKAQGKNRVVTREAPYIRSLLRRR